MTSQSSWNIQIASERLPLIRTFLDWNSRINLSAIRTPEWVYIKHVLDSLELTKLLTLHTGSSLLDVWTGGGFPLLPLAIQFPEVTCCWIDGRRKKLDAIDAITQELWIKNVTTVRGRIEDHHEQYDYVTARAVAYSDILLPELVRVTKKWGRIILYKLFTQEEDQLLRSLLSRYKLTLLHAHSYTLITDSQENQRILYILQK